MKNLTNYFLEKKDIIFKDLNEVLPKELNSRKKIGIFSGTSVNKEYVAVFIYDAKSRFIRKNVDDLEEMFKALVEYKGHNFKKKFLLICSPLCSKAKKLLEENKWSVDIDFIKH
ncbi:hypothetical protein [Arcobacter sp.]|uniref:hypothetical protein n=1 Tax=Arcobacter sp. TaxID=1872629 RepID=UPI003D151435